MKYRTDNKHSFRFIVKRTTEPMLRPFEGVRAFMKSIDRDIRMSEREDFDFFMTRVLDPERSRSIFA